MDYTGHCYLIVLRCLVIWIIVCRTAISSAGPTADNCDWVGSGSHKMRVSRGVKPVYLHCNQGIVRWRYPQGALRVVLEQRTSTPGPFSACVRRATDSAGARLYLAGRRRLQPVFRPDDPAGMVRCLASSGGRLVLYVEADPAASVMKKMTTEFGYYLRKVEERSPGRDADEECKPCTPEELLHQYCSSDFVFQGHMTSLFHDTRLQQTELSVSVSNIHRESGLNRFSESSTQESLPKRIVLKRPLKCGTKSGSGEYLFLGSWILGNPTLKCAPRMIEWKKVRRKALQQGLNECLLNL